MAIPFSWVPRNNVVQADVPVSHFEPGVAAPEGWQVVVECRYRADPGDAWGAPSIQVVTPPLFGCEYTPPAAGWVQATIYSTQNGLTSWEALVREFEVDGAGEVVIPARYIDEDGNPYVDQIPDTYYDA